MQTPAPALHHRDRHGSVLAWTVCGLAAATFGLHAGLLGSGQWQGDEFFDFAMYRRHGTAFLISRVSGWSPRPLSEAALYLYARAGLWLHRPLIAPMLAACWLMLLVPVLLAWRRDAGPLGWAVVAALCGMFLLGHRVSEMFFWPMAAAPYLACLGAMAFVVLRLVRSGVGPGFSDRAAIVGGLIVAGWCAEMGILFACCLCPLLMFAEISAFIRERTARRLAQAGFWVLPLLACLPLVVWVVAGRVDQPGNADQIASPAFHHVLISLRAAAAFVPEDVTAGFSWTAMGALALFGAGVFRVFRGCPDRVDPTVLAALVVALVGTAALSILTAEYQLGGPCCERHATFRQCLLVLLAVVVARWVAQNSRFSARRQGGAIIPAALLAAALAAGLLPRIGRLLHDYRQEPIILATTRDNWASGNRSGAGPIVFRLAPAGRLIRRGFDIPPGRYTAGPDTPWYLWGLMNYFGASSVVVLPP